MTERGILSVFSYDIVCAKTSQRELALTRVHPLVLLHAHWPTTAAVVVVVVVEKAAVPLFKRRVCSCSWGPRVHPPHASRLNGHFWDLSVRYRMTSMLLEVPQRSVALC